MPSPSGYSGRSFPAQTADTDTLLPQILFEGSDVHCEILFCRGFLSDQSLEVISRDDSLCFILRTLGTRHRCSFEGQTPVYYMDFIKNSECIYIHFILLIFSFEGQTLGGPSKSL